ncbi:MAG: CDGSH iron-sulfur domain-containing protein [Salinigranum sp.]
MPREVTHTARGPRKLTKEDFDNEKGDVAICQCGLSDGYPFCDGSHRRTEAEDPEVRYKYVDGERLVVASMEFADPDEER